MRCIDADALTAQMKADAEQMEEPIAKMFTYAAINDVKHAPTIEPEPQWILCSERLPENGRQVLVFARSVHYALAKYDEMREADGTYKKQWVTFDAWKPMYTIKNVIAWMELPSVYREEGD